MKSCLLLFIGMCVNCLLFAQQQFEIRYLGNMGISVTHNDSTILIDGLHDFYGPEYLPTDKEAIKAMHQKKDPYKRIIAIAFTHRHSDHFDSAVVTDVVNIHGSAALIGGSQTRSLLSPVLQRKFTTVTDSLTMRINDGLQIHVKQIAHTYPARHAAVENYRIEIIWNGFRIIHLGDADERKEALAFIKAKPDIIVIPSWFLSNDGVKLLNEIKPLKVLITHISPGDKTLWKNDKLQSEIFAFRKYGEVIKI